MFLASLVSDTLAQDSISHCRPCNINVTFNTVNMYDRPAMSRHATYSYPPQYSTQPDLSKQYPTVHSTSSAFSASANPNEDWTKISDLAERRRIQNRIAQRNYRESWTAVP